MLASINPATGDVIWEGEITSQLDPVIANARKAFNRWSHLPLAKRIETLKRFEELLKSQSEPFAEAISKEMGKPLWESKTEVAAMVGKIDISIAAYQERCEERVKHLQQGDLVVRHKPHGVCGVLGPFNFPGHLPHGHIVPALLAGNAVVFKPSELTPMVGELMTNLWREVEAPLFLIQGGPDLGRLLANHPDLDALFFTGSAHVGHNLAKEHFDKLLALEMGGNNPLVVVDGPIEACAYYTILSAFLTSGQRCSCARRLIVVDNEPFIDLLKSMIETITVGPYAENPFMGPLVSVEAANKVRKSAKLDGDGAWIRPTLIERKLDDEEIFGPLLQLIRVPDFDAAIKEANNTAYGLAASIFCEERNLYEQFLAHVRAGVLNWNRPTTGASSEAPFGGVGKSGNHRPSGYYAADYCSYPVASIESSHLAVPDKLTPGLQV